MLLVSVTLDAVVVSISHQYMAVPGHSQASRLTQRILLALNHRHKLSAPPQHLNPPIPTVNHHHQPLPVYPNPKRKTQLTPPGPRLSDRPHESSISLEEEDSVAVCVRHDDGVVCGVDADEGRVVEVLVPDAPEEWAGVVVDEQTVEQVVGDDDLVVRVSGEAEATSHRLVLKLHVNNA